MKVALVHYWLVNMAGGEKVLEALCRLYPQADIFTHVVDGETGLLFSEQTPESLAEALQRFEQYEGDFDPRHLHAHAKKFSTENFLTGFRHEVEAAMARM